MVQTSKKVSQRGSGTYRILVVEGSTVRPLQGMRLASSQEETDQLLADLRAMCPGDVFTFEALNSDQN